MAGSSQKSVSCPLFGVLAVKNQLITKAELEKGLLNCSEADNPEAALKSYLISQELISKQNMERLSRAAKALEIRKKEFKFGAIAVRKGFINQSILDLALEEQENDIRSGRRPRRIGDMLVESGLMTVRQRDYILKLQKRSLTPESPEEPAPEQAAAKPDKASETEKKEKVTEKNGEETAEETEQPAMLEPEVISGGVQLQITGDYMAALLTKTPQFSDMVSVSDIKEALFDKGIVSGIVPDDMINGFIQSSGFKTKAFRVAKGIRPIQGKDAKVEFFFNTDYLKAGGLDAEGNIDFKQRGEVPHVAAGTVLAEKTPVVPARRGHNIYGDDVETDTGEDVPLRFGKGAKLSEDGLKVLSEVNGFPKFSLSGVIYVHEEYSTSGDVDYETGHIEYDGNIRVNGCIKSGFKVKGNDIDTVELDGGVITADGDVTVRGGINEGTIYARGDVKAKFIHKSEIVCMGNVEVAKEIVDSSIECAGACIVEHGRLVSSMVTAKMGVNSHHIGTEKAAPCVIKVGHDAFTQKEMKTIQTKINVLKNRIQEFMDKKAALNYENAELQQQITKLAHIQDRSQLEQKEVVKQIKSLANEPGQEKTIADLKKQLAQLQSDEEAAEKNLDRNFEKCETIENSMEAIQKQTDKLKVSLAEVNEEKNNLTRWAKSNPGNPVVAVAGGILAGTSIKGIQSDMIVRQTLRRSKVMEMASGGEDNEEGRTYYEMKIMNY